MAARSFSLVILTVAFDCLAVSPRPARGCIAVRNRVGATHSEICLHCESAAVVQWLFAI